MTDDDRARRRRQRRRDGRTVAAVEVDQTIIEYLTSAEVLPPDRIKDRQAIGAAIKVVLHLLIAREYLRHA